MKVKTIHARFLSSLSFLVMIMFLATHTNAQISVTSSAGVTAPTSYTTLKGAFDAINAGTHMGVIDITVLSNTTETAPAILNGSALPSSYTSILIKPAVGATPTITSSISTNGPIYFNAASNVTIDGSNSIGGITQDLTIKNTTSSMGYVIRLGTTATAACSNITLKNCVVVGQGSISGTGGIVLSGTTITGSATVPHADITFTNNKISGSKSGIYTRGASALDNNIVITGNTIFTCAIAGMQLFNAQNLTVRGNVITAPTGSVSASGNNSVGITASSVQAAEIANNTISGATGIGVSIPNFVAGIHLAAATQNTNVYNNVLNAMHNSGSSTSPGAVYGIYVTTTSTGSNINVYNNFIRDVNGKVGGSVAETGHGIYMDKGDGVYFYHNTISMGVDQPAAFTGCPASGGMTFNPVGVINAVKVVDNIIVNNETLGNPYAIYSDAPGTVFSVIDYNDYLCPAGNLGYIGGTPYNTIAGIQAAFGGNVSSIAFSPSFISTSDLHLQVTSSNAPLNAGTFITSPSITTDIDGDLRVSPTLGADEVNLCSLPAITGTNTICGTGTTFLSNATSGGTWTSSNTAVATVDPSTGEVFGVAFGTATISYSTTCSVTRPVTVGTMPVTGSTAVCVGTPSPLSDGTPGGVWSSDNTAVATINSSGVVYGVAPGTVNISYTLASCPPVGIAITVSSLGSITGAANMCSGGTLQLSNASPGGTWTSSNTTLATVSGTGLVTAIAAGTVNISYASGPCPAVWTTITIGTLPITGITNICTGLTTSLSSATPGGVWSSDNSSVATVNASGVVSGVAAGTANISYTFGSCPPVGVAVTVATVGPITGASTMCAGSTTSLTNTTAGGTWSSGNTALATVSAAGDVTAIAAGTVNITYTFGTCPPAVHAITIGILPMSGPANVCIASTITLSDGTAGGTWTSGNTSVATIAASGVVTGVSAGTAVISYNFGSCAAATFTVTVGDPAPITGITTLCGGTSILSDATPGGTWSGSNSAVATVAPGSGVVTAVSTGTSVITYSAGGCFVTTTVTVTIVSPVTGGTTVCVGGTLPLSDATGGGVWTSGNTSILTVSATGVVTGVAAGSANITYTAGGCFATVAVTATVLGTITGTPGACAGGTTALSNATGGGVWTSNNTAIATVNSSTGVVSGVATGAAIITYTVGSCFVTLNITVAVLPAITGSNTLCVGATTGLSDAVPSGTWSSSDNTVATVSATGVVTGVAGGTVTITYSGGGCSVTQTMTVEPVSAGTISGADSVCKGPGHEVTLTSTVPGGVWTSSNTSRATVDPITGVVTGITSGSAFTITYTISNTCGTFTVTHAMYVRSASRCATGITETTTADELKLFPNPNDGTFTLNLLSAATEQVRVIVTNVLGAKVHEYETNTNTPTVIKLTVPPGIYMLTAVTEQGRYMVKVVVR